MGAAIVAAVVVAALLTVVVAWRSSRARSRARDARLQRLEQLLADVRAAVGVDAGDDPVPAAASLARSARAATEHADFLSRAATVLGAAGDVARVRAAVEELAVPYLAEGCALRLEGDLPSGPVPDDASVLRLPLEVNDELTGELVLWRRDRPLGEAEELAAAFLGERAAHALDQILRYTEQVRTSSTLEHSLLPAAVLPIEHLQVATRYLAAAEGQSVGGDFYDVLRTPAGAAVLIIGDVQGKGIEAATLTSTARHTLRAAALEGASPAAMLQQLNDALLYGRAERQLASPEPTARFVTVSVVCLTPGEHGFEAVVANGGHPPPLVIRPDGTVEHLTADGPLLGVFAEPCFLERRVQLSLSDVLVLYTDGVTEQRRQTDLFDESQLGRLVRNMLTVQQAEDIARIILDTVVVLNPREVRDDIALVVARVTGPR